MGTIDVEKIDIDEVKLNQYYHNSNNNERHNQN
jgi:hypothetical protein